MTSELSRRHALTGAATLGVGLPLLAACGADEPGGSATDPAGSGSSTSSDPGGAGSSEGALTTTGEVEVGGGAIFPDEKVVVTQPAEGDFRAFSATCTHQGCVVNSVSDGTIHCPCHGSQFSIEDGSVQAGPATGPLAEVEISVQGDRISLA